MSACSCVEPGNTRLSLVNNLNTCFLLASEDEGVEAVHVEDGAVYTGSLGGLVQVILQHYLYCPLIGQYLLLIGQ